MKNLMKLDRQIFDNSQQSKIKDELLFQLFQLRNMNLLIGKDDHPGEIYFLPFPLVLTALKIITF